MWDHARVLIKHTFHRIGYTDIEIKYSSPSTKERKIWGELVPYNEIWRAGANNATTIEFREDVEINGHPLAARKYGFFILPKENEQWEIIFNKEHDQWGAFNYNKTEDILRVQTLPVQSKFTEDLRYTVGFQVQTFHLKYVEKTLKASYIKADPILKWLTYVEGAQYFLKQNTQTDLALEWVNQGEKEVLALKAEWNPKYIPKDYLKGVMFWIKARLLAKKGNYTEALKVSKKLKATEGAVQFYKSFEEQMKIDETIADWETK